MHQMLRVSLIALVLATSSAAAKETVQTYSGDKTTVTPPFVVESPWLLDWRLDGDYDALIALDIALVEARTGRHVGRVLHTKRKGNGVKLFLEGGMYQLRISTTLGRWRVKIEQLTEEEAKLYVPKRPRESVF